MFTRMCRILLVLLSLSLFPAADARASLLTFEWDGGGQSWVGKDGFHLHPSSAVAFGIFDDLVFTTGPAVSVAGNGAGGHDYQFGDGLLTFYMGSTPVAFIPVLPFVLSLSAPVHEQIWGNWGAGDTVAQMNFVNLALGAGTLDPALAASLGVAQHTLGGDVSFIVDDFVPGPSGACSGSALDPTFRCGVPNNISGAIALGTVPEPATLALLALGGAGVAIRRRARRG